MAGLKWFLRDFADWCQDGSFDLLYERQRELVRCGLLPVRSGRGPGSGVPLTAETLATFLIGLLATDSLIDVGDRTKELCNARPDAVGPKNSFTEKRTFHSDLMRALIGSNIPGLPRDTGAKKGNLFVGIQVTRNVRGALLQDRRLPRSTGGFVLGFQGIEYNLSDLEQRAAPIISRTVSIEAEPWWTLCVRFREVLAMEGG